MKTLSASFKELMLNRPALQRRFVIKNNLILGINGIQESGKSCPILRTRHDPTTLRKNEPRMATKSI